VLDDLLDEWQSAFKPAFEGIRLLGTRWSPQSYSLREFLARNHVPYQWLDVEAAERDAEVRRVMKSLEGEDLQFPVMLFPDGARLSRPDSAQLADRIGLRTHSDQGVLRPGGSSAEVRRDWRRPSTAPPRVCAP
jgi:thioredoxin reductase (NADPH)